MPHTTPIIGDAGVGTRPLYQRQEVILSTLFIIEVDICSSLKLTKISFFLNPLGAI